MPANTIVVAALCVMTSQAMVVVGVEPTAPRTSQYVGKGFGVEFIIPVPMWEWRLKWSGDKHPNVIYRVREPRSLWQGLEKPFAGPCDHFIG